MAICSFLNPKSQFLITRDILPLKIPPPKKKKKSKKERQISPQFRYRYRDAGERNVVVVVVHVPSLLLLQAALVHGVQQDPVEGVQQLRLRRAEVED